MKRIREGFESGLRRVNTMGTMVFRIQRRLWATKYVTFYRLNVAYFLLLTAAGTFALWVVPLTTSKRLSFISALYTAVSALAITGLQTVESASLTYFHYCVIMFLTVLGSPMVTSVGPLLVRRYYFHVCIKQFALDERVQQRKLVQEQHDLEMTSSIICRENEMKGGQDRAWKLETFTGEHDHPAYAKHSKSYSISSVSEAEFQNHIKHLKSYSMSSEPELQHHVKHLKSYSVSSEAELQHHVKFQYGEELVHGMKGRVVVDKQQALRTLEYRALVALSWLIMKFLFAVSAMGFLLALLYFIGVGGREVSILEGRGINPYFFAMYSAITIFFNSGYCMTNDNMMPFAGSSGLLLFFAVLASIGNTLYAPVMRFLVWVTYKRAPEKDKSVYEYLLRHPRRCYTHLFPTYQTLWLLGAYIVMTGTQIFFMNLLEWKQALQDLRPVQKFVASYYQAVGTRNAGGLVVNLSGLAPAMLLIFVACMYMAAYPVFLSRQTTHVLENADYDDANILAGEAVEKKVADKTDYAILVNQSRRLLAGDTTHLVLAVFVLCLSESESIRMDPLNFSIFNIVFEVISAYGNIGISMGYDCSLRLDQETPCTAIPYSFSGAWSMVGRLVIIVVMFLGRHRGLADNIDSAIRLPTKIVQHSGSIPSTPPRTSNISNTHNIFQRDGDDFHQVESSHNQIPSSHDPSSFISGPPRHNITLSLWIRPMQSNPSCRQPNPSLTHPPLLALPSPAAASEIETTEVPICLPHPPEIISEIKELSDPQLQPSVSAIFPLTTSESQLATETLACMTTDEPLRLPAETKLDIKTSTMPDPPLPPESLCSA